MRSENTIGYAPVGACGISMMCALVLLGACGDPATANEFEQKVAEAGFIQEGPALVEASVRSSVDGDSERLVNKVSAHRICFVAQLEISAPAGGDVLPARRGILPSRRMRVTFRQPGDTEFSGPVFLDKNGCMSLLADPGTYGMRVFSQGEVQQGGGGVTRVDVRDAGDLVFNELEVRITATAAQTVEFSASPTLTTTHLVQHALTRFETAYPQRLLPRSISVRLGVSSSAASATQIRIADSQARDKWAVAEGVGRLILSNLADGQYVGDYSLEGVQCSAPGSYAVNSREFSSAAYVEGFAAFWGAASYNDLSDSDCVFFGGFECEEGTFDLAAIEPRFMERNCDDGSSFAGHASPVDLGKQFWDMVKTNDPITGSEPVTMRGLLGYLDRIEGLGRDNYYERFSSGVFLAGVEQAVQTRWQAHGGRNGIVHPLN